ncbi:hypothetical protein DICPUDRAFT_157802 [Dictyostelium purpureum]|uniref:Uncharacterized protein n=1 Tax=Dictyostelium purpureum TaxID=5786 RepID=F1A016_DICPU|nr:uncharacterized protein DICPUDRAFT_157802 [Dictyostelium purpureum]EGC30455.1 hypothetical protein DICPUDRAFT_157802 [Dictyostelium purpureum]|eukprot:XP_003293010.1 hypothetical protein DICPUDRAFT_157802 [Dictyostelium purpureum]
MEKLKLIKNEALSIFFYEYIELNYRELNIVVQIEDLEYSKNKTIKSVLVVINPPEGTLRKNSIINIRYLEYFSKKNIKKLIIKEFSKLTLLDKPISLHLIPHPCVKYKKVVDNKEIVHHKENYKSCSIVNYLKRKKTYDSLNGNDKKKIKTANDDIAKIDYVVNNINNSVNCNSKNYYNNTDNNNGNNNCSNIDKNNSNSENSSSVTVIKETQPFKLKNISDHLIEAYLYKGYKELYLLLFLYPKGVTGPSNFFSRLLNNFKYIDSGLINQKIDEYLISNNNNNKIFKLLSIYIFSHLNYLVGNKKSDIKEIKEIYKNLLTKINNREHIKSIHSFYKRINNKDKYYSINSDISDYLKFIDQSVEIEIRKYNFYSYQLQYSAQIISIENNINIKTINFFLHQKNNNNNNNNNPYNSNEIIKVYDQEVFNHSFYLKPDLYCNKNIFKSDFGNNPEEFKYGSDSLKDYDFYRPPKNGNYSISPSLELFKLCFGVFSSGLFKNFDWGEETDETRVIVSGGSISACLDTLPIAIKKEFIHYKTIERYLYKSKMPVLLVRKFMEFVFESSRLKELLVDRFFGQNSPTLGSDVDIWFIGQDLNSAKMKIYQSIENIKSNYREANPLFENSFLYVRTRNALTFFRTYPQRKIQFITKIYKSVDHLLSSFDMNCAMVFYDGSNVFMHRESIDSYNKRYNIGGQIFNQPERYRVAKYLKRGFFTFSKIKEYVQERNSSYVAIDSYDFYDEQRQKEGLSIAQMKDFLNETFGCKAVSDDPYYLLENPELFEISFKEKFDILTKTLIECKACRRHRFFDGNHKKFCSPEGNRCSGFYNLKNTYVGNVRSIAPFKYSLVLGGRTGLGFQIAFYLLDLGFTVFITSRFPEITKKKISQQKFSPHLKKLHIVKVDFNDRDQTENFIRYIKTTIPQLDLLFNTIKFSNKNENYNYSSIFNQLKTQEESLTATNINNNMDNNINNININNIDNIIENNNEFQIKIINFSNKNIIYKYDSETDESTSTTSTTNQIINNSMVLTSEYVNYIHYKFPKLIASQLISIIKNQMQNNEHLFNKYCEKYPFYSDSFEGTGIIFNINWKEGDEIDKTITLHNNTNSSGAKNLEKDDILYLKYPVTDKDFKKCYIKRKENQLILKNIMNS